MDDNTHSDHCPLGQGAPPQIERKLRFGKSTKAQLHVGNIPEKKEILLLVLASY